MRFMTVVSVVVLALCLAPAEARRAAWDGREVAPSDSRKAVLSGDLSRRSALKQPPVERVQAIALEEWDIDLETIPPFAPPVVRRSGDAIEMSPNGADPGNTFGFIEGPMLTVLPASNTLDGNFFGLRVVYEGPASFIGEPPEIRARLNSSDFSTFYLAGQGPNEFRASSGEKVFTATFDRNELEQATEFRIFIDFLSVAGGTATVDPSFTVRLLATSFFTTDALPLGYHPEDAIRSAYTEVGQDLFVRPGIGDAEVSMIREEIESYCYDGPYLAAIDNAWLYAHNRLSNYEEIPIETGEDNRVDAAAVSGPFVIYMEAFLEDESIIEGRVHIYNIETGERVTIFDRFADDVSSGGNGGTFQIVDILGEDEYDLFEIDLRDPAPDLRLVVDDDLFLLRTRTTGNLNQSTARR